MARFLIGHVEFPTKAAATAEVRRILHATPLDTPLVGRDETIVAGLYAMHPTRNGMPAPASFHVSMNTYHGSLCRGFQAVRDDGTTDPFSYFSCLSGKAEPSLIGVMRGAVMLSQREALRGAYHGRALLACAFCRVPVPLQEAHVHHLPPKFRDIADAFIGLIGEPPIQHCYLADEFVDIGIKRRWILFHDAVAHRVVVCKRCNAEDERGGPAVNDLWCESGVKPKRERRRSLNLRRRLVMQFGDLTSNGQ